MAAIFGLCFWSELPAMDRIVGVGLLRTIFRYLCEKKGDQFSAKDAMLARAMKWV